MFVKPSDTASKHSVVVMLVSTVSWHAKMQQAKKMGRALRGQKRAPRVCTNNSSSTMAVTTSWEPMSRRDMTRKARSVASTSRGSRCAGAVPFHGRLHTASSLSYKWHTVSSRSAGMCLALESLAVVRRSDRSVAPAPWYNTCSGSSVRVRLSTLHNSAVLRLLRLALAPPKGHVCHIVGMSCMGGIGGTHARAFIVCTPRVQTARITQTYTRTRTLSLEVLLLLLHEGRRRLSAATAIATTTTAAALGRRAGARGRKPHHVVHGHLGQRALGILDPPLVGRQIVVE